MPRERALHPGHPTPSYAVPGSEDSRLFEADDLLSERELAVEAAEALAPAEGQRHPDLDAARLCEAATTDTSSAA
jgi:hypothetical protein